MVKIRVWFAWIMILSLGLVIPPPVSAEEVGGDDGIAKGYAEQLVTIKADYLARIQGIKNAMHADYDAQLKVAMQAANVDLAVIIRAKRDAMTGDGVPPDNRDATSAKYAPQVQAAGTWLSSAQTQAKKNAIAGYAAAIASAMKAENLDKAVVLKKWQEAFTHLAPDDAKGGLSSSGDSQSHGESNTAPAGDDDQKRAVEKSIASKSRRNVQFQKFSGRSKGVEVPSEIAGKPSESSTPG